MRRSFGIVLERIIGGTGSNVSGQRVIVILCTSRLQVVIEAASPAQAQRIAEAAYPGWKIVDLI